MLASHLWALPYLLIYGIGFVVALVNLTRYPRVAVLSAAAFVILAGTMVAGVGMNLWMMHSPSSAANISRFYAVFGVARAVVDFVAFGMLVVAVFVDRPRRPTGPKGSV
jgi:hypothetical protein